MPGDGKNKPCWWDTLNTVVSSRQGFAWPSHYSSLSQLRLDDRLILSSNSIRLRVYFQGTRLLWRVCALAYGSGHRGVVGYTVSTSGRPTSLTEVVKGP